MARKHVQKRREAKGSHPPGRRSYVGWVFVLALLSLAAALAGAGYGLERLKQQVYASPSFHPAVTVELESRPGNEWVETEGWRARILSTLELPSDSSLAEGDLLQSIGEQLVASGWARKVERITRDRDGTIHVACQLRRPIAMVLTDRGQYIPIDREGVRLPDVYDRVESDSGWMRIVGIDSALPKVGQSFCELDDTADDAVAAVKLASLLFDDDDIAMAINGIDVSNFRGRCDKFKTHIKLWARDGRMAKWGSAIGEEFEEPAVADKLRNLALWLRSRSPQAYADLSVYRNGWLEPDG